MPARYLRNEIFSILFILFVIIVMLYI